MSFYIAVEGIVGCGKSTLLNILINQRIFPKASLFAEPYKKFTSYSSFNPLYEANVDPMRNSAITQLHIIQCSADFYPISISEGSTIISERSVFSSIPFIRAGEKTGFMTPYVTNYLLKEREIKIKNNIIPDCFIFLNLDPIVCMHRINARARKSEKNTSLEYQETLKEVYLEEIETSGIPYHILNISPHDTPDKVCEHFVECVKSC